MEQISEKEYPLVEGVGDCCNGKSSMKLLILVPELFRGTGGIREFNNNLIKALRELDCAISVVSINDASNTSNDGYPFFGSSGIGYIRKPTFIINTFHQVRAFKPDVIICGHVNFSPLCMTILKIFNIPYITVTHGIEVWKLSSIKLLGLKSSSKIVSVSRFTRSKIIQQLPHYSEDDIFILPNAVDTNRFTPKPRPQYLMDRWKIRREEKVLLTIARLSKSERYKGYDKVIMALPHILKEVPDARYILGGTGDDIERVRSMIKEKGLDDKVMLPGFIPEDELVDYYNLCDVFVMPSKGEGFGIVFIEALSCGKPVIAGNKDGARDALLDGEVGLLVDPDSTEDISNAIIKILNNDLNTELSNRLFLRDTINMGFGFDSFNNKLGDIIQRYRREAMRAI